MIVITHPCHILSYSALINGDFGGYPIPCRLYEPPAQEYLLVITIMRTKYASITRVAGGLPGIVLLKPTSIQFPSRDPPISND